MTNIFVLFLYTTFHHFFSTAGLNNDRIFVSNIDFINLCTSHFCENYIFLPNLNFEIKISMKYFNPKFIKKNEKILLQHFKLPRRYSLKVCDERYNANL